MNTFALDSDTVTAHTDALRADAEALAALPRVPVPSFYPFSGFHAGFTAATAAEEKRSQEVRDEARRVAAAMDLTVLAADTVDGNTSAGLGGML